MKKVIYCAFIISLFIILTACSMDIPTTSDNRDELKTVSLDNVKISEKKSSTFENINELKAITIKNVKISEQLEGKYKIDVNKPIIKTSNDELDSIVSKRIEEIYKLYDTFLSSMHAGEYIMTKGEQGSMLLNMNYSVEEVSSKYLSVSVNYYRYTGGAHGSVGARGFVVDLKKNNLVCLSTFCTQENYKEIIREVVRNWLIEHEIRDDRKEDENYSDLEEFYIKDNDIHFIFAQGELAALGYGVLDIPVSIDKLRNE